MDQNDRARANKAEAERDALRAQVEEARSDDGIHRGARAAVLAYPNLPIGFKDHDHLAEVAIRAALSPPTTN